MLVNCDRLTYDTVHFEITTTGQLFGRLGVVSDVVRLDVVAVGEDGHQFVHFFVAIDGLRTVITIKGKN